MVNTETHLSNLTSRLDKLLQLIRGYESALSFAFRVDDVYSIQQTALKLERLIASAYDALDSANIEDPACQDMLSAMLEQAMRTPAQLLARSLRYSHAGRPTLFHVGIDLADQPTLVGLKGFHQPCRDLTLQNLRLLNCDVSTDLTGSSFIQVKMFDCDFSVCRLNGTLWQEVRVDRSSFYGSDFSDAQIGDAVFVDCDFRSVNFDSIGICSVNAIFIRCDVADMKMGQLPMGGIHLINCRGVESALQSFAAIC